MMLVMHKRLYFLGLSCDCVGGRFGTACWRARLGTAAELFAADDFFEGLGSEDSVRPEIGLAGRGCVQAFGGPFGNGAELIL